MIDFYPLEAEAAIQRVLKLDWNTLIPGHSGVGGRYGTKADAQDQLTFLQDAAAAVKFEAQAGKSWDPVEKGLKLPKCAGWPGLRGQPAVRAAPLLRAVGAGHVRPGHTTRHSA